MTVVQHTGSIASLVAGPSMKKAKCYSMQCGPVTGLVLLLVLARSPEWKTHQCKEARQNRQKDNKAHPICGERSLLYLYTAR